MTTAPNANYSTGTRNVETIAQMTGKNTSVIVQLAGAATNLEQMSSNLQNMANRFGL